MGPLSWIYGLYVVYDFCYPILLRRLICQKKKTFYVDWDLEPATAKKGFLYMLVSLNNPAKKEVHFFTFIASNDYKYMKSAKLFWSLS